MLGAFGGVGVMSVVGGVAVGFGSFRNEEDGVV